ncbi:MAG: hypothetical protein QOF44_4361, partial [Streptomyces sp.]|nr:hypothetical protein [Streptomyces sp.]
LRELARFLAWMSEEHDVPLSGPKVWKPYPESYGSHNGERMSGRVWNGFKGVCGHCHVPENLHGDPGAIDFPTLIAYAREYAS